MLVCIGIVAAAGSTLHFAAFDASYAILVPDRLLPRASAGEMIPANGMMQTTWSLKVAAHGWALNPVIRVILTGERQNLCRFPGTIGGYADRHR